MSKRNLSVAVLVFWLTAGLAISWATPEAPPPIEGNPGVPGLLAQIAALEEELAAAQARIAAPNHCTGMA